jgi:5-methylcytosine-specific restriction endonuclease McrA
MKYSEKLKDPRWQKKRLEIFSRDNWKCIECGSSDSELHIHHKKYSAEPWDIDNEFLETLCHKCHTIKHSGINFIHFRDSLRKKYGITFK